RAHVATEMEREGFKLPLLIGGATTSKTHTAVKIAPGYSQPVVHVLDASRAVPVVGSLVSPDRKAGFAQQVRAEYDRVRAQHAGQHQKLISLEQARQWAPKLSYGDLPQPQFIGVRVLSSDVTEGGDAPPALAGSSLAGPESEAAKRGASQYTRGGRGPGLFSISLSDLVSFIDWSPFFHTWELRGRYPAIL